ncbi:hypothetical protein [Thalassobius sp. Cn5-15]|uniref:hypothetical protein n=1 Tax=Thalassobius sp. Cn5-15 TaxID=2917763 RepID=UPI001EF24F34|nr:hypothetical protein [Thalassobius sp. Cn5-15]MCG7492150.1 hypothetical protein [Thalassobius sp. Cn5-15]
MPIAYSIEPDLDLVYMRIEGAVIIDEALSTLRQYLKHPDYRPNRNHLHDLSRITLTQIEFQSVLAVQNKVMTQQQATPSQNHVVFYAPTKLALSVAEDLKRLWAHFDTLTISVVETTDAAAALLERDPDAISSLVHGAFPPS